MTDRYLIPGLRTPFVKAGGVFAGQDALSLSVPIAQAMAEQARPDLLVWGQVIPSPRVSNIGRELLLDAKLDPTIPSFATTMACSTSMMAAIEAAGLVGHSDFHLALVGGVETMSRVPIALTPGKAMALMAAARDPAAIAEAAKTLSLADFDLPVRGWANRISGRSMGEHTEDTVKHFAIARAAQDEVALWSHQRAVAAQGSGFFSDLILPFGEVAADNLPRGDSTADKLASLPPVFDRSGAGSITAGNSSPLTDGAASLWVADAEGRARLGGRPAARLVDWQLAAMDWHEEGILMSPARAIPRLLARNGLTFADIDLFEIHEAFAGQVLANVKAVSDPAYRRANAKVDVDLGDFPWERFNPNGGSLAIGHPFAATGARILSQTVKELAVLGPGRKAIVSICVDGGQGTAVLLESA
ncbi:thiolase family protein [Sphingoaurantiacus capsulatus]|uniref:Thiolase family protein n=1 Tax=Sphingoaurantiacus capsulatus TaxID=1771310 RepID=A0ABV7X8F4_9SPHN